MRKCLIFSTMCFIIIGISTILFASGRNKNGNMSAEWCKTLNRFASTDVDASFFNPAGTAFLPEGFYMYLGNEVAWQPIDIKVRGGDLNTIAGLSRSEYKGEKDVWYFPIGHMVMKKGRLSIAGCTNGLGGGGVAKFKNGLQQLDTGLNPTFGMGTLINGVYSLLNLNNGGSVIGGPVYSKVWASSAVYNIQLSVAYEVIKDKLSLSLGGRFLIGNTDADINIHAFPGSWGGYLPGGSDFHTYQIGFAGGVIAGICYKPAKDFTFAISADWNSPLNLKSHSFRDLIISSQDPGQKNNGRSAQQLPATVKFGIAYKTGGLQISPGFAYDFNQFGQWKGKEKGYTGGYDVGLGLDYTFTDIPLNIGIGYLWSFSGARPSARDQLHEELNGHSGSIGFTWSFSDRMQLTIGEVFTYFLPENVNAGATSSLKLFPVRFEKYSTLTAIGLTTKI